jgi:membrane protein implicated in regulation of membrane protease activity
MVFLGIVPVGFVLLVSSVAGIVLLIVSPPAFVIAVLLVLTLLVLVVRHKVAEAREARQRIKDERMHRQLMTAAALRTLQAGGDAEIWTDRRQDVGG